MASTELFQGLDIKKDLRFENLRSKIKTGYVLLSQGLPPSTIAAEALHFCVRYGNRCFLLAMAAEKFKKSQLYNIGKTAKRTYAFNVLLIVASLFLPK